MKLKLYGYWRSSASWRVRWALEIKKVPYDYVPVNILKNEHKEAAHLARNPFGLLPAFEMSPGNFLSESMAILWWIEENCEGTKIFGSTAKGADPMSRYKILQLAEYINSDTAPLQSPRVQKMHSSDAKAGAKFAKHFIREGLAAYQAMAKSTAGKFSVGDSVTAADLFLIPQLYNARRFEIDVANEFPLLASIDRACYATSECKRSSPEAQVDAVIDA